MVPPPNPDPSADRRRFPGWLRTRGHPRPVDPFPLLVALVVPCVLLERAIAAHHRLALYDRDDTRDNLGVGVGGLVAGACGRVVALPLLHLIHEHRVFEFAPGPATWVALLLAHDACYYAFHRASHRVRVLWAAHATHHSSAHYNLTTGFRLSWITPFTGIPFWWPLPWLGFDPLWILGAHALSLGYQFCLHTQLVGRLGPLEWIFNTPSHHRVHHGSDAEYLDKNFGGVLIVWDRLLGTFAPQSRPPTYGLVESSRERGVLAIAWTQWCAVWRDALRPGVALHRRLRLLVAMDREAGGPQDRQSTQPRWNSRSSALSSSKPARYSTHAWSPSVAGTPLASYSDGRPSSTSSEAIGEPRSSTANHAMISSGGA